MSLNAPKDSTLEEAVSKLIQDFENMNVKIAKLEGENQDLKLQMTSSQTSAFHAVLGSDRSFENLSTVIFDNKVTDEGSNYNSALGTYRCPVSGIYFFTVTFQSRANRSNGRIMINGSQRQVGPLTSAFDSRTVSGASTQTATIRCNAGEDVYVQAITHSNYVAADLKQDESTFSGFLLSQA